MRLNVDFQAVTGEMLAHIGAFDLVLLAALIGDDDDLDAAGLGQKRHGVGDGARRLPAAVPAHHDIVELERRLLDIGHQDHRPAGFEQRGLGDDLFHGRGLGLGLADDGEIEAPRDAAELVAGAGEAGDERQRLRRQRVALGRRGETVDGGFRGGFVVGLLRLDHFGGDVAGRRYRNDRIVEKSDAGQMRVQGAGD